MATIRRACTADLVARKLSASVLLVVSLVVALALAEGVLRLIDFPPSDLSPWIRADDTAYKYAPGLTTRMRRDPEYDIRFRTNSLGLRDDEISAEPDGFRILLLGDSFTAGYGVDRGSLFSDLLDNEFTDSAGRRVDVVNAGVGGYEIVHQVHYFRSRGRAFAPDLVVYALYLGNDISRNGEWVETSEGLRSVTREYPVRVTREVKLTRLIRQSRYMLRERRARLDGAWVPFDDYLALCERELAAEARAHYTVAGELLARLRDVVVESGARFVVAPFAFRTAIDPVARREFERADGSSRYDLNRPEREILALLDAEGIDTVNLNDALRAYHATPDAGARPPLYFEIDGHFNEQGHRVVAEALAAALKERAWCCDPD